MGCIINDELFEKVRVLCFDVVATCGTDNITASAVLGTEV